jgi:hypothetical protein
LLESEQIDVRTLITHEYKSLEQVGAALAGGMEAEDYVKGVVTL